MRVWHVIVVAVGVVVGALLAVCAEVRRDAEETQEVWDAAEAQAQSPLHEARSPDHWGLYAVESSVYWTENDNIGLKLERKVLGGVPMISLQRPDGSPLACVDLNTGNLVVGPCVAKLRVLPVRKVEP